MEYFDLVSDRLSVESGDTPIDDVLPWNSHNSCYGVIDDMFYPIKIILKKIPLNIAQRGCEKMLAAEFVP